MVNIIIKTEEKKETKKEQIISFFKDLLIIFLIVILIRAFFIAPFQIKWDSMNNNFYDKEFILVSRFTTINFPFIWEFNPYKRWDVVVFEPRDKKGNLILDRDENWNIINYKIPDNNLSKVKRFVAWPKTTYIKRVIGLPWETVRIEWWDAYIKRKWTNGFVKLSEDFLNDDNNWNTNIHGSKERKDFVIPEWKYFVMWDNRINSGDSRICFSSTYGCSGNYGAFVEKKYLIWKVWFDVWYFNFNFKEFSKNWFIHPKKWIETKPRFLDFPKTFNYNL